MSDVSFDTLVKQFATYSQVSESKWFGKTCLKVDGKAFVVLFGGDLAFKLAGDAHGEALKIEGAHLFDPRGKGNAFKEWVQIPLDQASQWPKFAVLAHDYVSSLEEA